MSAGAAADSLAAAIGLKSETNCYAPSGIGWFSYAFCASCAPLCLSVRFFFFYISLSQYKK
jgi:hypothetical protein